MFAEKLNLAQCCVLVSVTCVDRTVNTPAHGQRDRFSRLAPQFVTPQALLNPAPFVRVTRW